MTSPAEEPDEPGTLDPELEERAYEIVLDPNQSAGEERIDALCAAHPEAAGAIRALVGRLSHAERIVRGPDDRTTPMAPGDPPRRLGEYELVREAGRGGMGVVFEAWQQTLRRSVALKVLPAHFTLGAEAIERFRREGAAGARLRHESIIDVFGFGEEDGHHFLAMEFVEGAPLHEILRVFRERGLAAIDSRAFAEVVARHAHRITHPGAQPAATGTHDWPDDPVRAMVEITAQIAEALAHAHRAGIVHRDVKPSNILIRPDGQTVLTDFGLARDADLPALTVSGEFTGTPSYASPEQATGRGQTDGRSDVFSLGATLYEMITLEKPFPGDSSHEVLECIQRREPIDPRRSGHHIELDLSAVVLKALEKQPTRRYQTAAEFGEDLRAILEQRPIQARRAGTWTRLRRWVQREPLRATIATLLLVGVPTIAILGGVWIANAPKVAAAEELARHQQLEVCLTAAQFSLGSRDYQLAAAAFRSALGVDPASPEAAAGYAYAVLVGGDTESAQRFLDGLSPTVHAHPAVARVALWVAGGRDSQNAQERTTAAAAATDPFELALLAEEESRRSQSTDDRKAGHRALALLNAAARSSKRARPWIHSRLAQVAGECDDRETVRQVTNAMRRLWPEQLMTFEGIALANALVDPDAAIAAANRGMAITETVLLYVARSEAYLQKATQLLRRRKVEEAESAQQRAFADCRAALQRSPGQASLIGGLARLHYFARDYEAALAHADQAIALDPNHQQYLWYRAHALKRLRRYAESAAAWQRVLNLFPNWEQAWNNLADVAVKGGDKKLALRAAREAVRLRPKYVIGLCTLAETLVLNGEYPEARDVFRQCTKLAPKDRYSWQALAEVLLDVKAGDVRDPKEAAQAARRASELTRARTGRRSVPCDILLGRALVAQGAKKEARTVLQPVQELLAESSNPRAKQYLEQVEALLRATQ